MRNDEPTFQSYPTTRGGPSTALVGRRGDGVGLQAHLLGEAFVYWPGMFRPLPKVYSPRDAAMALEEMGPALKQDWIAAGAPTARQPDGVRWYAGVGARATPKKILDLMERIAGRLSARGYGLRSGGADGADTAFELGAGNPKQIFQGRPSKFVNSHYRLPPERAFALVDELHPAQDRLDLGVRYLMARNAQQVLGPDLRSPSGLVICWTEDGAERGEDTSRETGGTGHAIRIASKFQIPCFNLKNEDALQRIAAHLDGVKDGTPSAGY